MQRLLAFRIAGIVSLRALTSVHNRSLQVGRRRMHLTALGCTLVLTLLSGGLYIPTAIGDDLIEPEQLRLPVPEIPPTDALSKGDHANENDLRFWDSFEDVSASAPAEHAVSDYSNDVIASDPSGHEGLYSPTMAEGIFVPMVPEMLSPRPFVHERRTVRTSQRAAEIWVKLPKDSQSSVSVNFVEYPPEGDFRIFRTRVNTFEPKQFYLSAKRWDGIANRWIDLEAFPSLSSDGTPGLGYIDLSHGQRHVVSFIDGRPDEASVDIPSVHVRLDKIERDILNNHEAVGMQIQNAKTSIEEKVAAHQQSVAPHDRSRDLTKAFKFNENEQLISGEAVVGANQIESVNWGSHPKKINLFAATVPRALPRVPFKANLTFMILTDGESPFATLEPIPVEFQLTADGFKGEVDFNTHIDAPLATILVGKPVPPQNLQLSAVMECQLDHGELGLTRVSGKLGNSLDMTITEKAK